MNKEEVVEKVQQFLANLEELDLDITAAYLYGSQAAGTAHKDSDIDVAVVTKGMKLL